MKDSAKYGLLAGGVLLLVGGIVLAASGEPLVYEPGDTAKVKMGQSITLKLPRGQYEMVGGAEQVVLMSTKDVGKHTVVTLLIGVEPVEYETTIRFVTPQGDDYELDVEASNA